MNLNSLTAEGMRYRTLRASRGIYVLILEAKLGSGPKYGPKRIRNWLPLKLNVITALQEHGPRVAHRNDAQNINSRGQIGLWSK
jgi:hypothetical protein